MSESMRSCSGLLVWAIWGLCLLVTPWPLDFASVLGAETNDDEEISSVDSLPEFGETDDFIWETDSTFLRLWGNAKNLTTWSSLNSDSLLNPSNIQDVTTFENTTRLKLRMDASVQDRLEFFIRGRLGTKYEKSERSSDHFWTHNLDQAYATWHWGQDVIAFLSVGKQRIKWGTGLYWNPVDTFNPAQNLNNRQRTEEGKVAYRLDLLTEPATLTWVVVPNADSTTWSLDNFWGAENDSLMTWRARTFVWDTDLAAYASLKEDQEVRWGASFAIVKSDIQVFGEGLYWSGRSEKRTLVPTSFSNPLIPDDLVLDGTPFRDYMLTRDQGQFFKILLGLQYTFSNYVTLIAEYYHNSDGYTGSEVDNYLRFLRTAGTLLEYQDAGMINPLIAGLLADSIWSEPYKLLNTAENIYTFADFRQNYLHLSVFKTRVANRFNLGADIIVGLDDLLDDRGYSQFLRLNASYVALRSWSFGIYGQFYDGAPETEFGMLPYDYSLFGEIKYYF